LPNKKRAQPNWSEAGDHQDVQEKDSNKENEAEGANKVSSDVAQKTDKQHPQKLKAPNSHYPLRKQWTNRQQYPIPSTAFDYINSKENQRAPMTNPFRNATEHEKESKK
jgi:hypothetical protein